MIYVIEPHADDAFISCGGHIEVWLKEQEVTIVTAYSADQKRALEAATYAARTGCSWLGLDYNEGEVVPEMFLWDLEPGTVVLPIGIQHEDHKRINALSAECKMPMWFYADTPYYSKVMNQQEVHDKTQGLIVQSILCPHARKWKHVEVFKSQAKFFHFNPKEELGKLPEIILRRPT